MSQLGAVGRPVHEGPVDDGLAVIGRDRVTMSLATWHAYQESSAMEVRLDLALEAGATGLVVLDPAAHAEAGHFASHRQRFATPVHERTPRWMREIPPMAGAECVGIGDWDEEPTAEVVSITLAERRRRAAR